MIEADLIEEVLTDFSIATGAPWWLSLDGQDHLMIRSWVMEIDWQDSLRLRDGTAQFRVVSGNKTLDVQPGSSVNGLSQLYEFMDEHYSYIRHQPENQKALWLDRYRPDSALPPIRVEVSVLKSQEMNGQQLSLI